MAFFYDDKEINFVKKAKEKFEKVFARERSRRVHFLARPSRSFYDFLPIADLAETAKVVIKEEL